MTILVVDDDMAVAQTVKMVLRYFGHSVDVLHDGGDAFARLALFPHLYDIVITDHSMRYVTGLEMIAQLKGTPFRGGIIALSGSLTTEEEEAYLEMGAGMIMRKPFDLEHLRQAVDFLRPLAAA